MTLQPATLEALSAALADAHTRGERVASWNLAALNRVTQYTPEDMTVTVETGITLEALQARLRTDRQWLPVDPPAPQQLTIGALIATNANGPRRFGHGTIREHLLGLRVALADGQVVKAGGRVVKNVAGYDLCKLFVGSRGALGIIVEATFKVQPLPETEQFRESRCDSWEQAARLVDTVAESPLTPVVFDLWRPPPLDRHETGRPAVRLALGFAGAQEDVEWQLTQARALGVDTSGTLDYDAAFWRDPPDPRPCHASVLPSRVVETLRGLGDVPFVARAGNGTIYWWGGPDAPRSPSHQAERPLTPARSTGRGEGGRRPNEEVVIEPNAPEPASGNPLPTDLLQRVKDAYDPRHILPELRL